MGARIQAFGHTRRWPRPPYERSIEPHFLFIVTPPYSGSTAISVLLNTSQRTMLLQRRGEGQWLIPGLCDDDRWDPAKDVDYESIRAVWLGVYQQVRPLVGTVDTVIEKSPPNMVRMERLAAQFSSVSFIANNRDPYASCASHLYRKHDPDSLKPEKRVVMSRRLAEAWVTRSRVIRELVHRLDAPLVTYERFCDDPRSLVEALQTPDGVTDRIDTDAALQIKDYSSQGIVNHNDRQIADLRPREIDAIGEVLATAPDLLDFFGYRLM